MITTATATTLEGLLADLKLAISEWDERESELEKAKTEIRELKEMLRGQVCEVRCARCDRPFRTIEGVRFCTEDCEIGRTPLPYQRRVA